MSLIYIVGHSQAAPDTVLDLLQTIAAADLIRLHQKKKLPLCLWDLCKGEEASGMRPHFCTGKAVTTLFYSAPKQLCVSQGGQYV